MSVRRQKKAAAAKAEHAMRLIRSPVAMARLAAGWNRPVVLVPTMGALHAGHLSLVARARRAAGKGGMVVVSIFVNPTQFAPHEDLSNYPRPLRRDLELCGQAGVDVVFHPDAASMYAGDASIVVDETLLSAGLCGASRAGHFRGVCTVVAKLFNLVRPSAAVFGRKDYQQLAIIRRMVRDLDYPIRIIEGETVRDRDGLALSSRNVYLSAAEREQAPAIRRALLAAEKTRREDSGTGPAALQRAVTRALAVSSPLARLDYVEVLDAENLQPITRQSTGPILIAVAVYFGKTRLIDNIVIGP